MRNLSAYSPAVLELPVQQLVPVVVGFQHKRHLQVIVLRRRPFLSRRYEWSL